MGVLLGQLALGWMIMITADAAPVGTTVKDADRDGLVDAAPMDAPTPAPGGGVTAGDDIVGVSWGGNSYAIDSGTGAGRLLASGGGAMNAMARDNRGTLFATKVGPQELLTVDPDTGRVTRVAPLNPRIDVRGMSFSPDRNALFAMADGGFGNGRFLPDKLYTIDAETGATMFIGTSDRTIIQAMAFAPDGTLYAWDIPTGLLTIDLNTGRSTDVNPDVGGRDMQTLAFAPDGTLYGGRNELYTIDTRTGRWTLVGSGGYADVRGMDFLAGGVDCDAIRKFKAKCRGGKLKTVAKAPDLPGQVLTILRNDGDAHVCVVNNRGKCVSKFGRQAGMQTMSIQECPERSKDVDCG